MKNSVLSAFVFASLLLMSCGGSDAEDCTSAQFNSEVSTAAQNLSTAGQAWAADATQCTAFVQAANDYLDVVESYNGCGAISQTDYNAQIDAARAAINSLPAC